MEKLYRKITFTENGTIHARLINNLEEEGAVASKPIDKIDRKAPKAVIALNPSTVEAGNTITATVTQSDEGGSGVNITKCKWGYTTTDTKTLGENPSSYTGGYFKQGQTELKLNIATIGTYYLHILTIDNAGNPKETVSSVITIKKPPTVEDLKNGNTIRCKVLWDADSTYGKNGVQIISMSSLENVTLWNATTSDSQRVNEINGAVPTLNNKTLAYLNTSLATTARCVGSVPNNPSSQGTPTYNANYSGTLKVVAIDENYLIDYQQMERVGAKGAGEYWLASFGHNSSKYFGISYFTGSGIDWCPSGFRWSTATSVSMGTSHPGSGTRGLRPVFTLKPEIRIVNNNGTYSLST